MKLVYNLGGKAIAKCENKQLGVVGNEISVMLICTTQPNAQLFVTAHIAGCNTVGNVEVNGGIYIVPKDLVKAGKLMMRVEAVESGEVVQSWLLEPIELMSSGQLIEATLIAMPDMDTMRDELSSLQCICNTRMICIDNLTNIVHELKETTINAVVEINYLKEQNLNKDMIINQLVATCSDLATRIVAVETMLDDPSIRR